MRREDRRPTYLAVGGTLIGLLPVMAGAVFGVIN